MADQNMEILLEEALDLSASKRFREYKGEEVQVNGRYGPYIRHGAAFVSCQKEKTL
jgi:DNA topoisomerase-1